MFVGIRLLRVVRVFCNVSHVVCMLCVVMCFVLVYSCSMCVVCCWLLAVCLTWMCVLLEVSVCCCMLVFARRVLFVGGCLLSAVCHAIYVVLVSVRRSGVVFCVFMWVACCGFVVCWFGVLFVVCRVLCDACCLLAALFSYSSSYCCVRLVCCVLLDGILRVLWVFADSCLVVSGCWCLLFGFVL